MTATQLPLSLAQRHNNQQLFSDHYLNITLPARPEWKLLAHDAGQALAAIAPIVRAYVRSDDEAQTEEDLIRPVLRALEYTFISAKRRRATAASAQLVGERSIVRSRRRAAEHMRARKSSFPC